MNKKLQVDEHKTSSHSSVVLKALLVGLVLLLGYFAGVNHYKIKAAIAPIFGYQNYQSEIDLSSVNETYQNLAANYDGDLDINSLIDGANAGLVAAAGDSYTIYMTAEETEEYNKSLSGDIGGGVGIEVGERGGQITVIGVLDGNPAKEAGLKANDIIIAVNGQLTSGLSVDQAVMLIRGDEGTTVKITIQRGDTIQDYSITRAIVNNPSVTSKIIDNVGIMTISRFDDETASLARQVAQGFVNQNVKGVILDLRNNGGGYVNAAQEVVGLWLDGQTVVIEKVSGIIGDVLKTGNRSVLSNMSTVVLVNFASASASEIVAGALQDHGVATIVGENTYGKGTMQRLISLSRGAQLKVTVAHWYTPNDNDISESGITPDVRVILSDSDYDQGSDPQLDKALELIK